ncbi:hypothetical protein P7C70_g2532, partial [Phenoliferia sp. Uapishka_3]
MEPIEASLVPSELTKEQDERYRMDGAENQEDVNLGRMATRQSKNRHSQLTAVGEEAYGSEKMNMVSFEAGKGEDPREFSRGKKWAVTICTSSLCLAVALGSSIVTGDLQSPVKSLHSSQEIINLSVSLFVAGFGLGPLLFAPLSEILGRKPIYCVSMFGYFIFTLPAALAKNSATLVVSRLIAGTFASAPMCNVGGSLSDVWEISERGIPMAIFSATIFVGPCLGPILGGWIGQDAGWRYIYWVLFALTGVTFLGTLVMPETLSSVLLKKKADRLRKETGDNTLRTQAEVDHIPFGDRMKVALIRPFILMFMVGSVVLPVALFIFAFTGGFQWVNFMGPCVAGAIFGFSLILIYVAANSYIVDSYSDYAASAVAAKTFMRSEVAAAVPLFSTDTESIKACLELVAANSSAKELSLGLHGRLASLGQVDEEDDDHDGAESDGSEREEAAFDMNGTVLELAFISRLYAQVFPRIKTVNPARFLADAIGSMTSVIERLAQYGAFENGKAGACAEGTLSSASSFEAANTVGLHPPALLAEVLKSSSPSSPETSATSAGLFILLTHVLASQNPSAKSVSASFSTPQLLERTRTILISALSSGEEDSGSQVGVDEALFWVWWCVEEAIRRPTPPSISEETLFPLIELLTRVAALSANPATRFLAFRLLSTLIVEGVDQEETQFMLLKDLVEDCPYDAMQVAALALLQEMLLHKFKVGPKPVFGSTESPRLIPF